MTRVFVRRFKFEGNTVFSQNELSRIVVSYTGREIESEEMEAARRVVTQYYVNHGFINSGATILDQEVRDGTITIRIVEGQLTAIKVTGNIWLRTEHIRDRLALAGGASLNVHNLRDGLQLLRQNPNVQQVNAELQPGGLPGESELTVRVRDRQPFWLTLQVDNTRPPSVGSEEIRLFAGDRNLTGNSDALEISYGIAHNGHNGFVFGDWDNIGGAYTVPLTARETAVRIFGSKDDFAIIEEPFDSLDITSESKRIGASVRQPLYETANRELALMLTYERRESRTFLLGRPFSIEPGAVRGEEKISAIRFAQEWTDRSQNQVLALRSTFSFGVDAFSVTDDGTDRDAKFWVWQGQFQFVRRLGNTPSQLILRTDAQWTDQPLLSLEQFTLGGAGNVRGYRENQLVRDRGVYGGIEVRVPVLVHKNGAPMLQLVPFFDFGAGWNVDSATPPPATISSAGIGVLFALERHLRAQFYWGHPFRNFHSSSGNLQDSGIHFQVSFEAF